MKSGKSLLISLLLLIWLAACQDTEIPDRENLLIGCWEFIHTSEVGNVTITHMKRINYYRDKYGTMFLSEDGHFAYRGSWGFAGQPANFTGTWTALNDTVIQIEIAQPFQEDWNITVRKVDREAMEYYYVYENQLLRNPDP